MSVFRYLGQARSQGVTRVPAPHLKFTTIVYQMCDLFQQNYMLEHLSCDEQDQDFCVNLVLQVTNM